MLEIIVESMTVLKDSLSIILNLTKHFVKNIRQDSTTK